MAHNNTLIHRGRAADGPDVGDGELLGPHQEDVGAAKQGDRCKSRSGLRNDNGTCYQNMTFWWLASSKQLIERVSMVGNEGPAVDQDLDFEMTAVRDVICDLLIALSSGEKDKSIELLEKFWEQQRSADKNSWLYKSRPGNRENAQPLMFLTLALQPILGRLLKPVFALRYEVEYRCSSYHVCTFDDIGEYLLHSLPIPQPAPPAPNLADLLVEQLTMIDDDVFKDCSKCKKSSVPHGKQWRILRLGKNLPDVLLGPRNSQSHVQFPDSVLAMPGLDSLYYVKYMGALSPGIEPDHTYGYSRGPPSKLPQDCSSDRANVVETDADRGKGGQKEMRAQDSFLKWTKYDNSDMELNLSHEEVSQEQMYVALLVPVDEDDIKGLYLTDTVKRKYNLKPTFVAELEAKPDLYAKPNGGVPETGSEATRALAGVLLEILGNLGRHLQPLAARASNEALSVSEEMWTRLEGENAKSLSQEQRTIAKLSNSVAGNVLKESWPKGLTAYCKWAGGRWNPSVATDFIFSHIFDSGNLARLILEIVQDHIRVQRETRETAAWAAWVALHPRAADVHIAKADEAARMQRDIHDLDIAIARKCIEREERREALIKERSELAASMKERSEIAARIKDRTEPFRRNDNTTPKLERQVVEPDEQKQRAQDELYSRDSSSASRCTHIHSSLPSPVPAEQAAESGVLPANNPATPESFTPQPPPPPPSSPPLRPRPQHTESRGCSRAPEDPDHYDVLRSDDRDAQMTTVEDQQQVDRLGAAFPDEDFSKAALAGRTVKRLLADLKNASRRILGVSRSKTRDFLKGRSSRPKVHHPEKGSQSSRPPRQTRTLEPQPTTSPSHLQASQPDAQQAGEASQAPWTDSCADRAGPAARSPQTSS